MAPMVDDYKQPKKPTDSKTTQQTGIIDLDAMRDVRQKQKKPTAKSRSTDKEFTPQSWNITYKKEHWRSGGLGRSAPDSRANSGHHTAPEPFFNIGTIPFLTKAALGVMVAVYLLTAFILPQDLVISIWTHGTFSPLSSGQMPDVSWMLSSVTFPFMHMRAGEVALNALMLLIFGMLIERHSGPRVLLETFLGGALIGASLFAVLHAGQGVVLSGAAVVLSALFGRSVMVLHAQAQRGVTPMVSMSPKLVAMVWAGIIVVGGLISQSPSWPSELAAFGFGLASFYRHKNK